MKHRLMVRAWWMAVLVAAVGGPLIAGELHVDKTAPNRVSFTARFMGETFDGVTGRIDGYVYWKSLDPSQGVAEGSAIYFEVDLNTLDTGIGLRNQHMREDYLKTGRYPYAAFKGRMGKMVRQGETDALVTVEGTMSIHGKDHPVTATARVTAAGERYAVSCSFPLDIRDYGIEVPSLMGAKVDPMMTIEVNATLVNAP